MLDRIKRLSNQVLDEHKSKFGEDFADNKKVLDQISIIHSKGLKNEIAGYITKFIKREIRKEKAKKLRSQSENPEPLDSAPAPAPENPEPLDSAPAPAPAPENPEPLDSAPAPAPENPEPLDSAPAPAPENPEPAEAPTTSETVENSEPETVENSEPETVENSEPETVENSEPETR